MSPELRKRVEDLSNQIERFVEDPVLWGSITQILFSVVELAYIEGGLDEGRRIIEQFKETKSDG